MTDRDSSKLGEFTWYSRLAAWIGAAMLLAQSVLGRSAGPVTVLAVLLLGIGFLCFLIGLALDSRVPGTGLLLGPGRTNQATQSVDPLAGDSTRIGPETPALEPAGITSPPRKAVTDTGKTERKPPDRSAAPSGRAAETPGRRPKFRERAKRTDVRPEPPVETQPAPAVPPEAPTPSAAPQVERPLSGVATEMLSPANVTVGAECPRCESTLRVGQLVATCPVCGRTHHAICWMENHFHCATLDCTGHGSLEAPSNETEQ